ncbi:MAG: hypothetical protein JWM99_756 [Verrucomicrobiales bacterium]|nr:hypothetical protein [Verrucomicrobiales bacterium]
MARNVKYQPLAVRFGPAIKAALLCAFFASAGIGYVWQKTQIQHLADQIKRLEGRKELLGRQNDALTRAAATLSTPSELDARVRKMNLGLVRPQPDQIIRLHEASGESTAQPELRLRPGIRETVQLYASRR